jgi:uncharacterized protein YrrD
VETTITAGTDVFTNDGQKVGHVAYVVVDPHSFQVTDLVVSTGDFIGRDIVVAMDQIERESDEGVYLKLDRNGLDGCPDYVDLNYQTPPDTWLPAPGLTYPTGAMLWPAGFEYPEAASVTVNTPEGTVGLHQGMDVVSSDDHKVGSIDAVLTSADSEEVTGFVVKHGFIFTHDTTIPVDQVDMIENDRVKLKLSRDAVERELAAEG